MIQVIVKPGAAWSITVPDQSVCQGIKRELELVSQITGKAVIRIRARSEGTEKSRRWCDCWGKGVRVRK